MLELKKYIIPIILIIVFCVILPISMILFMIDVDRFTLILPGNSGGIQTAMMMWLISLSAIFGVLIGYALAPIYLFVHRKFFGKGMIYGIEERAKEEEKGRKKFSGMFKGIFPALMTMNIALMFAFNTTIQDSLYVGSSEAPAVAAVVDATATMFIITMLSFGAVIALFSGTWFLLDSGLVFTNKEKIKDKVEPIEVRNVGGTFLTLLKGYAGIGVLISFYSFVVTAFEVTGGGFHFSLYLFLILWPIFLAMWCLPAILLMNLTWKHRKEYILKKARELGAIEIVDIDIKSS